MRGVKRRNYFAFLDREECLLYTRRSNTRIEYSPLGAIDQASVYRPLQLRDAMQHSFNLALYMSLTTVIGSPIMRNTRPYNKR